MDSLAQALLPTLLHELANTTQLLTGLHALVSLPEGAELLATHEGELSRAGDQAQRLGWLLGVLGAAGGHDILLARREARGLVWMASLAANAARREERPHPTGPEHLPHLLGCTPDGWSIPWAFGSLLWQVGDRAHPEPWSIVQEDRGWRCRVPGAHPEHLVNRVPGAELVEAQEGAGFDLLLPTEFLSSS